MENSPTQFEYFVMVEAKLASFAVQCARDTSFGCLWSIG